MPWRGPEVKGEYPTLGYAVAGWIEANCVIPDGELQGEPYRLTDEMFLFLLKFFRLQPDAVYNGRRPSAAFHHRGGQLMRPQKWGKGPFAAAIVLAEAFGPVRFAGWDEYGEPVGKEHPTPWVQLVATSEEQTDNTWLCVYEMARRSPTISKFDGVDIGVEDINLPSGGKIERRSSSGKARLGARLTFAIFDETHLFVESNGGVLLATTMKRNIGGMGGRWLETTNAYDPSQKSIAQRTQEAKLPDVVVDYRPPLRVPRADDDDDCLNQLRHVYGDSWWVDVERILQDARDPGVCPTWADALRYFFNLIVVGVSDAVDATLWAARARARDLLPLEHVALGFDGSRSQDCTSIMASRIRDGRWFHIKTWDPADYPDHQIPRDEVDAMMSQLFEAYRVWYMFGDPYGWQPYFDKWSSQWPTRFDGTAGTRIVEFPTNIDSRIDDAVVRFRGQLKFGLTHDGDETLRKHIAGASLANGKRRAPRPEEDASIIYHYLRVIPKRDKGHIDAFIAGLLAEVARGKAIEEGALAVNAPTTVSADLRKASNEVFRPTARLKI